MKKIILGTSDACLMSRLSQQTSDPAYYIEDCRIFRYRFNEQLFGSKLKFYLPPVAKALTPTVGTNKPSAMLAVVLV